MRRFFAFFLAIGLVGLGGCTSGAPPAPLGLDRHPANTPQALAALLATGERTPDVETAAPLYERVLADTTAPTTRTTIVAPFVISDFSTPGGVRALSAVDRETLVEDAKAAASVIILVRADAVHPNRAVWNRLALRRRVRRGQCDERRPRTESPH